MINKDTIFTKVQTAIDATTSSTSLTDLTYLSYAAKNATEDKMVFVNTLDDLPNLVTTNFPAGVIYFVKSIDIPVVSNNNNWYSLDGNLIKTDGSIMWGWGSNNFGQLGNNDAGVLSSVSPVSVVGQQVWKNVETSYTNGSFAIKSDDTLWAWGRNTYGQLGDGTTVDKSSSVSLISPCNSWTWKQVSAGEYYTVNAIKSDGTMWGWGGNSYGAIGNGINAVDKSSPVSLVSPFNSWTWKQVSAGNRYSNSIKSDGTIWSWGYNLYGQLGDGTTANKSSPVSLVSPFNSWTWKQISAGSGHSIAIKSDDTLWSWGYNILGGLGIGNNTIQSSPVSVVGGFTWKTVSCSNHSVAIKSDDTLWSWGQNDNGQLGINNTLSQNSPVSVVGGFTWKQVTCGSYYTLAIKSDDTLWSWGKNDYGQLGDGTTSLKSSPVSVVGGFTWKQVSAGGNFNVALKPFE